MISRLRACLRRRLIARLNAPDIPASLEGLASRGLMPNMVFDVGAFRGEFAVAALEVWPETRVACFEPLRHGRAEIKKLQTRFPRIDLHETLVGAAAAASVPLHVRNSSTSLLRDSDSDKYPVEHLPVTTLDEAIASHYNGRPPELLKLDVQGYELEVLKGSERSLSGMRAILSEVNLLDLHENVPLLDEIVGWLAKRNFVAYDICGLTRRPLDRALWQADFIFVHRDDPLRANKGYFPEHRKT